MYKNAYLIILFNIFIQILITERNEKLYQRDLT